MVVGAAGPSTDSYVQCFAKMKLTAGQYITMQGYQVTGAPVAAIAGTTKLIVYRLW